MLTHSVTNCNDCPFASTGSQGRMRWFECDHPSDQGQVQNYYEENEHLTETGNRWAVREGTRIPPCCPLLRNSIKIYTDEVIK